MPLDPYEVSLQASRCILVLAALGFCILLIGRRRFVGTTMIAPWFWTTASFATVLATEIIISATLQMRPLWYWSLLRYVADVTTLCPIVAVLGAKRPQNGPWQFVVLTLLGLLLIPIGQHLAFRQGQPLVLHGLVIAFLFVPPLIGLFNYAFADGNGGAAGLAFFGQIGLLVPHAVSFWPEINDPRLRAVSLGLIVLAISRAAFRLRRDHDLVPLDKLWRDFRNLYGVVWAARLAERVNAAAAKSEWRVRLDWKGFRSLLPRDLTESPPPDDYQELQRVFTMLLRRFVSAEWIARRLPLA